ncbi:divergent polysaccharide deacetylase family protein [Kiloniella litopenaei]|uniref:divergent polysaccharide deacetylase family protein n=1 Tax=Kiloniella litopenaei TaxID=1549748 RepID=UPI000696D876|nr:divergent polysaccharide deacetylase family protein [Kiloniella litopenaei]
MVAKRKTQKTSTLEKKSKKQSSSHRGSLFIVAGFLFFIALAVSSVLILQKNRDHSKPPEPQPQLTEAQVKKKALEAAPANKPHPINLGDISIDDTVLEDGRANERANLPPNVTVSEDKGPVPTKQVETSELTPSQKTPTMEKGSTKLSEVQDSASEASSKDQLLINDDQVAALPPKQKTLDEAEQRTEWVKPARPMIAVVLDDVGVNKRGAELAIELPGAITLAFMTYAPDVKEMAAEARKKGHELMLHVPMEPLGSADPGPKALLTGLSDEEILARLEWGMAQFDGYIGINNHMGSKFTGWRRGMEVVMSRIEQTDHFFMDSRTSPRSVAASVAASMGVPVLRRDVFIDNDYKDTLEILKQLKQAERIAKKNGHAIAIGHPHKSTVEVLHSWIKDAEARGFDIVPISQIMALKKPKE